MNEIFDELLARLERVESELDLHRLTHDYCIGADQRDMVRWTGVWTEDACWGVSPDRIFRGIDEIRRAVEDQWRAFPRMQHGTVNHIVDINGDQATGRTDVVIFVNLRDGKWITGGGTYEDVYRRDGGRWRIARRTVLQPFDLPLPESDGTPLVLNDD
jgi:ketosteroid isomerase-like protein